MFKMPNIVLIGMPSCGKSTIGKQLAKELGYNFVDTDNLIVKKHEKALTDIIDEVGYDSFLKIEGDIGFNLNCDNTVIATGGSMVLCENAMLHLKEISKIVFINTPINLLEERLKSTMNTRGVATPVPMTTLEIYNYRMPYYLKYCDYKVQASNGVKAVVQRIINALKQAD